MSLGENERLPAIAVSLLDLKIQNRRFSLLQSRKATRPTQTIFPDATNRQSNGASSLVSVLSHHRRACPAGAMFGNQNGSSNALATPRLVRVERCLLGAPAIIQISP